MAGERLEARGRMRQRAAALLVALFLILYALTVHAQHLFAPSLGAHGHASDLASLSQLDGALPALQAGLRADGMDCPLPSLLAPRIGMPLPAVMLVIPLMLVVPMVATGAVGVVFTPPPRPPGPTRQALLERFQL